MSEITNMTDLMGEIERLRKQLAASQARCADLENTCKTFLAARERAVWLEAAKELEHRYNRTWDCLVFIEEYIAWCRQQAEGVKP